MWKLLVKLSVQVKTFIKNHSLIEKTLEWFLTDIQYG